MILLARNTCLVVLAAGCTDVPGDHPVGANGAHVATRDGAYAQLSEPNAVTIELLSDVGRRVHVLGAGAHARVRIRNHGDGAVLLDPAQISCDILDYRIESRWVAPHTAVDVEVLYGAAFAGRVDYALDVPFRFQATSAGGGAGVEIYGYLGGFGEVATIGAACAR